MSSNGLYVSGWIHTPDTAWVTVETLIILFVYKIARLNNVYLTIISSTEKSTEPVVEISLVGLKYTLSYVVPKIAMYTAWPLIVTPNHITAGICSVARSLIKLSELNEIKQLLGFRDACLFSCSATSIWTRFCEVDIVRTMKNVLEKKCYNDNTFYVPPDILRLEYHLSTPVKIHNIYKIARINNKNKNIKSGVSTTHLNINHTYSEGPFMTLSDVILYVCYEVFFQRCPLDVIRESIPLTINWFDKMESSSLSEFKFHIPKETVEVDCIVKPDFVKQSFYTTDPITHRPEKRIFTKQDDIEIALNQLEPVITEIKNEGLPFGEDIDFSWSDVPLEANPKSGALPKTRSDRKCQQLENLAKAVIKIADKKRLKIVDFCSGSGHLGILLATLLPQCEIILVENKERSLIRAKERIEKLQLSNVFTIQCNLDYFQGDFDLGVGLHACGVATDLVIQTCIAKRAHLIVCPCCYGGIHNCHNLNYPRSRRFENIGISIKSYLNLAHAADQTHDEENLKTKQGYLCMDAIDTDRRFYIENCGYKVHLGKLSPTSCTNKNNLLVGLVKECT